MAITPDTQAKILAKCGSTYKAVVLFQRRMRELVRGLPPLLDVKIEEEQDLWDLVAREILEGKVDLIVGEEAEKIRREQAAKEEAELPKEAAAAPAPAPAPVAPAPEKPLGLE
ncbi:MAG: hypothetical protein AMXMBFR7_36330 [Planctomycetota bacterium]